MPARSISTLPRSFSRAFAFPERGRTIASRSQHLVGLWARRRSDAGLFEGVGARPSCAQRDRRHQILLTMNPYKPLLSYTLFRIKMVLPCLRKHYVFQCSWLSVPPGFGNANCPNARGNSFRAESTEILL